MFIFSALYQLLRSLLVPRLVLVTENLALRQQLLVLRRSTKRPGLRYRDRFFWVSLSHLWRDWRSILVIVKPWQNPHAERLIGSIRRECLDHVIVFSETHLRQILREYFDYYNGVRPH